MQPMMRCLFVPPALGMMGTSLRTDADLEMKRRPRLRDVATRLTKWRAICDGINGSPDSSNVFDREGVRCPLFVPVNAETPPFGGGVSGAAGEPDDYLLSHRNPHYHRRGGVSRSCSGWEWGGPT